MNLEEFLMNRVLLGGEYPTGSVAAAENTEDPDIPKASQQRLFVLGKLLYLWQWLCDNDYGTDWSNEQCEYSHQ